MYIRIPNLVIRFLNLRFSYLKTTPYILIEDSNITSLYRAIIWLLTTEINNILIAYTGKSDRD